LTGDLLDAVLEDVPDEWIETTPELETIPAVRAAYRSLLDARLQSTGWVPGRAAA
jgi:hypothetical protein